MTKARGCVQQACVLEALLRCTGNVISDPNPAERKTPVGDGRVARVILDPAQYHQARSESFQRSFVVS